MATVRNVIRQVEPKWYLSPIDLPEATSGKAQVRHRESLKYSFDKTVYTSAISQFNVNRRATQFKETNT